MSVLFPCLSVPRKSPGWEWRGRRCEGNMASQSPGCTPMAVNLKVAAVCLKTSPVRWTKVVIKLISCVNFFLFCMWYKQSQVYLSLGRNPQWWVCTSALIGPIDLLCCIYNCLEIVNRCWSLALMVSHICSASTLPTRAAVIREHLATASLLRGAIDRVSLCGIKVHPHSCFYLNTSCIMFS